MDMIENERKGRKKGDTQLFSFSVLNGKKSKSPAEKYNMETYKNEKNGSWVNLLILNNCFL